MEGNKIAVQQVVAFDSYPAKSNSWCRQTSIEYLEGRDPVNCAILKIPIHNDYSNLYGPSTPNSSDHRKLLYSRAIKEDKIQETLDTLYIIVGIFTKALFKIPYSKESITFKKEGREIYIDIPENTWQSGPVLYHLFLGILRDALDIASNDVVIFTEKYTKSFLIKTINNNRGTISSRRYIENIYLKKYTDIFRKDVNGRRPLYESRSKEMLSTLMRAKDISKIISSKLPNWNTDFEDENIFWESWANDTSESSLC